MDYKQENWQKETFMAHSGFRHIDSGKWMEEGEFRRKKLAFEKYQEEKELLKDFIESPFFESKNIEAFLIVRYL